MRQSYRSTKPKEGGGDGVDALDGGRMVERSRDGGCFWSVAVTFPDF